MKKSVIYILILLLVATIASAAPQIIVNSGDWTDVYSAMLYGSLSGTTVSFLVSDKHSTLILNSIDRNLDL